MDANEPLKAFLIGIVLTSVTVLSVLYVTADHRSPAEIECARDAAAC